jgi:hypothetical protein
VNGMAVACLNDLIPLSPITQRFVGSQEEIPANEIWQRNWISVPAASITASGHFRKIEANDRIFEMKSETLKQEIEVLKVDTHSNRGGA